MAYNVRKVEYFYTTVNAKADEAYGLLDNLANLGVNFLALTLIPMGPESTQITLFPEETSRLQTVARQTGLILTGPYPAVLVQGDDEIGVLASILKKVHDAKVDVFASSGIADGRGGYGFVLYVRPADAERAARALAG